MKAKSGNTLRVFSFGKYKGEQIINICQEDPGFVDWCVRKNLIVLNKQETLMRDKYYAEQQRKSSHPGGRIPSNDILDDLPF